MYVKMEDETIITLAGYVCGTIIVSIALLLGYNHILAATAVGALWGVRELVGIELRRRKKTAGDV